MTNDARWQEATLDAEDEVCFPTWVSPVKVTWLRTVTGVIFSISIAKIMSLEYLVILIVNDLIRTLYDYKIFLHSIYCARIV